MEKYKKKIDGIFDGIPNEGFELPNSAKETIANLEQRKPFVSRRPFWIQITSVAASVMLMLSLIIVAAISGGPEINAISPQTLSRDTIISRIESQNDSNRNNNNWRGEDAATNSPPETEGNSGNGGNDFATTNVQHEGIDEGDIIKVDSNYIYKLSSAGLVIVNVGDSMSISCKIDYENFVPVELFIQGNKLIVIGGVYEYFSYTGNKDIGVDIDWGWFAYSSTKIMIYDLKDRVNLELLNEYTIDGTFLTSRLIDNKLIFTVQYYFNRFDKDTFFPKINGTDVSASKISFYRTGEYFCYYIVGSINITDLSMDYSAHLGLYGTSYFSKDNLYLFHDEYNFSSWWDANAVTTTVIVKINLHNLKFAASGRITGFVNDRYQADEYNGYLRVVSYVWKWSSGPDLSHTRLYILDNKLKIVGSIFDIAVGERLYAVRFNGDRGNIITAVQVDPLFTLDLSNPKNPTIDKGLVKPDIDMYLQYLSDDILLGLGMNTIDMGGWTTFGGMKVSLYDITGEIAERRAYVDLGTGRTWSEALYNPKAILNDTAKNMLSFPVEMWDNPGNWWNYTHLTQGLAVFKYDLNDENMLVLRGVLSNLPDGVKFDNWYEYYDSYYSFIRRGARIGNKIYTISDKYITSYDIETLELVQQLRIAEFKSAKELWS